MIIKKSTIFFIFLTCAICTWQFYLKYSVVSAIAKHHLINMQQMEVSQLCEFDPQLFHSEKININALKDYRN